MFFHLLQTAVPVPEINPDSLEAKRALLTEKILDTPPRELLASLGEQAIQFGLKVLGALVIYIIGAWVIKVIRRAARAAFERRKADATLITFADSLISVGLWIVLIIIAVSTLGVNTTSLAALLAAGGVAIGMALSGTVQNFAGGMMLLLFKPFKVGDFIEAQGFAGFVTEVNMVNTKLTTTDNRTIILPNGALFNGNINNVSGNRIRRIDLPISVAYGTDAQAVKDAVLEIIDSTTQFINSATEGAADPFVALTDLGESSVNFVVRVWVKGADYWTARFWLTENIYTQLPAKYGIQFPFPQLDVHLKQN